MKPAELQVIWNNGSEWLSYTSRRSPRSHRRQNSWLAYCEWVWSLHTDCQTADAGWPEEEQIYGQELFSLDVARDVWQQGAQATQFRLNDSHELWNRWMSTELEQLPRSQVSKSITQQDVERVRMLFLNRLQIPHATWDETSQMFSTFLTKYDEAAYESTMVHTTKLAENGKKQYGEREIFELRLRRAGESGDADAQKSAMREYLEWEVKQLKPRKKGGLVDTLPLCVALYERALSSTALLGLRIRCLAGLYRVLVEDQKGISASSIAICPIGNSKSRRTLPLVRTALG